MRAEINAHLRNTQARATSMAQADNAESFVAAVQDLYASEGIPTSGE